MSKIPITAYLEAIIRVFNGDNRPLPQSITLCEEDYKELAISDFCIEGSIQAQFMGLTILKGEPRDPILKLQKRVKELEAQILRMRTLHL